MGIGTAIGVGGIATGIGAGLNANAAGNAADAQVSAANHAADIQHQDQQAALAFQEKEFNTQQKNIAPWLKAGTAGINTLSSDVLNGGFPGFNEKFQAPTGATEQNDPGYQFRLTEGQRLLENSAASRGGLLSGGTAAAEQQYGQDYASNEYGNVYNRAMQQYLNRFNIFETNQTNKYNRLANLAGVGQVANQQLGEFGQAAAGNVANIDLTSGAQIGSTIQNAGAARASGYLGQANAINQGIGGVNNLAQMYFAQQNGLLPSY